MPKKNYELRDQMFDNTEIVHGRFATIADAQKAAKALRDEQVRKGLTPLTELAHIVDLRSDKRHQVRLDG